MTPAPAEAAFRESAREGAAVGSPTWWAARCRHLAGQLETLGLPARATVWFVPGAHHQALAEAAWARSVGGWMPRLRPRPQPRGVGAGSPGLRLDPATDPWQARRNLLSTAWGRALAEQDPHGLDAVVSRLCTLARGWYDAAWLCPPATRAAWAEAVRVRLGEAGPTSGSLAAPERALARLAFEWAMLDHGPELGDEIPADAQVVALMLPPVGLGVRVAERLAAEAGQGGRVVLQLEGDATDAGAVQADGPRSLRVCASFEEEARETAGRVLAELASRPAGGPPVALITEDRRLARRARALLEASGVRLADETGWTLSTTRAAATLMAVLDWAGPSAGAAQLLALLKAAPWVEAWDLAEGPRALDALELFIEAEGCHRASPEELAPAARSRLTAPALALWLRALALRDDMGWAGRRPWAEVLTGWREAARRHGLWTMLEGDEAGRQVLAALRWDDASAPPLEGSVLLTDAVDWVRGVLESSSFRPSDPPRPQVHLLPLQRAVWRHFHAVVMPSVDAQTLGGAAVPWPWLGHVQAQELGLAPPQDGPAAERWAFDQILKRPRVHLLRRRADTEGPVAPSPWLQQLELHRLKRGEALAQATSGQGLHRRAALPVQPPRPVVAPHPGLWPRQLSATRYEALRACPYQFMARVFLGLRETERRGDEPDRRDQGLWLHAVLHRFHTPSDGAEVHDLAGRDAALARLQALAEAVRVEQGLAAADFLPWAAWFDGFAPRYVDWWLAQQEAGARFLAGEASRMGGGPELAALDLRLEGRVDRIDRMGPPGESALRVLDYKIGSGQAQKDALRRPQEDSQLAFYAALMLDDEDRRANDALRAAYLPLSAVPLVALEHPEVEDDALALREGLAADWRALRAGAPLRALGEGRTCEQCAMMGLCRKAHWSGAEASS